MPEHATKETFVQKLALLVIDKIVLGAIIGIALIFYDQYKTAQEREYQAERERNQIELARANSIRELLPLVSDSDINLQTRLILLKSLFESGALEPTIAYDISLTQVTEYLANTSDDTSIISRNAQTYGIVLRPLIKAHLNELLLLIQDSRTVAQHGGSLVKDFDSPDKNLVKFLEPALHELLKEPEYNAAFDDPNFIAAYIELFADALSSRSDEGIGYSYLGRLLQAVKLANSSRLKISSPLGETLQTALKISRSSSPDLRRALYRSLKGYYHSTDVVIFAFKQLSAVEKFKTEREAIDYVIPVYSYLWDALIHSSAFNHLPAEHISSVTKRYSLAMRNPEAGIAVFDDFKEAGAPGVQGLFCLAVISDDYDLYRLAARRDSEGVSFNETVIQLAKLRNSLDGLQISSSPSFGYDGEVRTKPTGMKLDEELGLVVTDPEQLRGFCDNFGKRFG